LRAELPGIAAHAVRSLRDLMLRGAWEEGESAARAKAIFEQHVDVVRFWIADATEPAEETTMASALYNSYKLWCNANGAKPLGARAFYERVQKAGYRYKAVRGMRQFEGIHVVEHRAYGDQFTPPGA
jgi:phage/plasmid-associated DNA primase